MNPILDVKNLRLGFQQQNRLLLAVDGISFQLNRGETFALVGESGCGKSAAAQAILRLHPVNARITEGSVTLDGKNLFNLPESEMRHQRGRRISMIFQEPGTSLNPVLTIGQQLGEVLTQHTHLNGEAARQRMIELLQQVGIADPIRRLDEYPFQFSGGMKQRVMIAIALAGEPDVLIADEPTTALDVTVQAQILSLLERLQQEKGMAILLITHDLGVVARMAHHIGVMYAGQLVEIADKNDFFSQPRHPYTQALFAALPESSRRDRPLQALAGQVPPLDARPTGCRFASRCPQVLKDCQETPPPWQKNLTKNHHWRCQLSSLGIVPLNSALPDLGSLPKTNTKQDKTLLTVDQLKVHFPIRKGIFRRAVGQVRAVDGISFQLSAGKTLALVGESGCGKTTAGKAILQLLQPTGGQIKLKGESLTSLTPQAFRLKRQHLQMIFQDPFASLNPRLRVGEILAEGMQALGLASVTEQQQQIAELLQQVGLPQEASERYPHEFSGGQRQRIAIARALAVKPEVLICDEPTSALDVSVQAQILNLLKVLQNTHGISFLFITHNFAVVDYLAHDIAVMYLGRIVEQGTAEAILKAPKHPYTKALLSAVPQPRLRTDGTLSEIIQLSGEAPSPANPPSGCHFHPRCPHAQPICRTTYPEMSAINEQHHVACHGQPIVWRQTY